MIVFLTKTFFKPMSLAPRESERHFNWIQIEIITIFDPKMLLLWDQKLRDYVRRNPDFLSKQEKDAFDVLVSVDDLNKAFQTDGATLLPGSCGPAHGSHYRSMALI